jgi:hypothetical protein
MAEVPGAQGEPPEVVTPVGVGVGVGGVDVSAAAVGAGGMGAAGGMRGAS